MNTEKVLSVVIPVYNEAKTINVILDEVLARPETAEIIVVDDASIDNSKELIQKYVDRENGR
ncbi:MAG: glycosyltransferase, partial [Lentisphaerota bacterium]